jgi:hypothetical protein
MVYKFITLENFHYGTLHKNLNNGILTLYILNWGKLVRIVYDFKRMNVYSNAFSNINERICSQRLETNSFILLQNDLGEMCFTCPSNREVLEYKMINFGMTSNVLERIMRRHFEMICRRKKPWEIISQLHRLKSGTMNIMSKCKN